MPNYDPNPWMGDTGLQDLDFGSSLNDLVPMPEFDINLGDYDFGTEGGPSGSGSPWYNDIWRFVQGNWRDLLGAAGGIGSGIVGMNQANQLSDLARQAFTQSDPFASQRPQYQEQLSRLMNNSDEIFEDPAFKAALGQGTQTVERSLAARGLLNSGNAATELQQFGQTFAGDFRNQRIAQLSSLAGAGIAPNFGAALGAQGASSDLLSQALAALGYGAGRATGMGQSNIGTTPTAGNRASFNSAGGEAAQLAQILRLGAGVTGLAGGLTGNDFSSVSAPLSGAAGIISGLARGDTAGYLGAARGAASLAGRYGADWAGTAGTALGTVGSGLGFYNNIQNLNGNPIQAINTLASGTRLAGGAASLLAPGALSAGGSIASGAAANAALAQAGFGATAGGTAAGAGAASGAGGAAAGLGAAAGALGVMGAVVAAPAIIGSFASRGQNERNQEVEQYYATSGVNRMGFGTSYTTIQLPDGRLLRNPTRDQMVEVARAYASGDTARYNQTIDDLYRSNPYNTQLQQGDPRWMAPGSFNSITPAVPDASTLRMRNPRTPISGQRE